MIIVSHEILKVYQESHWRPANPWYYETWWVPCVYVVDRGLGNYNVTHNIERESCKWFLYMHKRVGHYNMILFGINLLQPINVPEKKKIINLTMSHKCIFCFHCLVYLIQWKCPKNVIWVLKLNTFDIFFFIMIHFSWRSFMCNLFYIFLLAIA